MFVDLPAPNATVETTFRAIYARSATLGTFRNVSVVGVIVP